MCNQAHNIIKFLRSCKGFEFKVLNKLKFKPASNGNCLASLVVDEEHLNLRGILHSGFSMTLVDVVSSVALLTHEKGAVPSVSVDMHVNFLKKAEIGDVIDVDARVNRCGKMLAFLDVTIAKEKDGEVLMKGSHTKMMLRS